MFTGVGVLIGPVGLDVLDLRHDAGSVLAALALLLFTDAMKVRRRDLRTGGFLPLRLLAIGLPLSIGAESSGGRWRSARRWAWPSEGSVDGC
ncbi:hypothetical protein NLX86_31855 [Streptomyces sp. A3M-1-3]|uniref:hypothetical protein n=1 Tax=Streptomyces sp. A3M-1-3 TaxID=2962044 RepID=UPI0020B6E4FE|nr:hypothetical protein [Streptomyces sp. A3M-1-3]MCP3822517.1 hypothetical protein [Streptomyces sp. A3M-1-3]